MLDYTPQHISLTNKVIHKVEEQTYLPAGRVHYPTGTKKLIKTTYFLVEYLPMAIHL